MKEFTKKHREHGQKILLVVFGFIFLVISRELLRLYIPEDASESIHISIDYILRITVISWFLTFIIDKLVKKIKVFRNSSERTKTVVRVLVVVLISFLTVLFFYNKTIFFYLPIIYPTFFHLKVFWWDVMNIIVATYAMYRVFGDLISYIVGGIFLGFIFGTFAFFNSEIALREWISVIGYFAIVIWYSIRVWRSGEGRNIFYQATFFFVAGITFGSVYLIGNYEVSIYPYALLSLVPYLSLQIFDVVRERLSERDK